jgi:hypothetical protein
MNKPIKKSYLKSLDVVRVIEDSGDATSKQNPADEFAIVEGAVK